MVGLLAAYRNTYDLDAMAQGGVFGQRPPATSQIQETVSLFQPQLAAKIIELSSLRALQILGPFTPVQ